YGTIAKQKMPSVETAVTLAGWCSGYDNTAFLNEMFSVNDEKKVVDIWIISVKMISPSTIPLIQARQSKGEEIWLYESMNGLATITHYLVAGKEGIANRLWPWFTWKLGGTGMLYYYVNDLCSNRWKYTSDVCPNAQIYQGSGAYFYPSCKTNNEAARCDSADNTQIVPTIRWELLREGMEDAEYFKLLNSKGSAGQSVLNQAMNLLGSRYYEFDSNAVSYYSARNAIAQKIEELS
ncbi:MAG: hypothetical protein V1834_01505, partial [Candidatus Micrarchaeota archaeon]